MQQLEQMMQINRSSLFFYLKKKTSSEDDLQFFISFFFLFLTHNLAGWRCDQSPSQAAGRQIMFDKDFPPPPTTEVAVRVAWEQG